MPRAPKKAGFTLVEVMVSSLLLTLGVVSCINAFTRITNDQRISVQSEHMQRLAMDKYDELVATEALQTQSLNGDFSDRNEDNYLWSAAVNSTGTDNLSALSVTVTPRNGNTSLQGVVNGVVYIPPQTSTGGSTGTTGGG